MTDRIVRVILRGDIVSLKAAMAEGATVVKGAAEQMTAAAKTAEKSGATSATASGKVTAARKIEADASGAVRVAETRLAEVRTKGTAKASQVAAAEERLAKAQRAQAAAVEAQAVKSRAALTTLGSQAGKVGFVAGAGLAYAVKSAADFGAEMALVQTLSHASASDMDKLSHAALTVGQNIGYSAKAVAQGEEEMVKAGVSVTDILGGGLKGALDLAAAGQTDVATATTIAASAMTEFGLKGKDIPHLADELAAGADKALGSVEDLGQGLTQAGTTAHQMGLSMEETVGTLTAFAQAGLIGERGGTTLKQMLLQLSSPTKNAQALMDKYGISLYNASGQIKTMPQLAGNLSHSLKNLDPAARNAALGIIFGSRAIQGANILMANGQKGIQDWINKTNDQGFAAQQASGKLNSLSGDLKKFEVAFQTAFIGVGDGSQGPLRDLTQGATDALNAFNKLPDPIKHVTGDLLLLTAVTGGGLWFGSKVVSGIASTRTALSNLGVTAESTKTKLSGVKSAIGSPWGAALTAGLVVGGLAWAEYAKKQAEAKQKIDDLRSSLDAETGAITDNTKQTVINQLESDGLLKAASRLGISLDLVTAAAMGNTSALQQIQTVGQQVQTMADGMNAGMGAAGGSMSKASDDAAKLVNGLTDQNGALKNAVDSAHRMADAGKSQSAATQGVTAADRAMARSIPKSTAVLEAQTKAFQKAQKAARQTAQQFVGVGKSVNDTKVSLDSWIKDLEKQAQALRDFTKNAQTAGKNGLRDGLIKELEAAGPEGALRMKQLADGTNVEIKRANQAWASGQRAIAAYVKLVAGVPPTAGTNLHVNGVPAAISAVDALKRLIDDLHDRNIHITVTKSTNATLADATANSGKHKTGADGATVPSSGRTYADRWPYLLADGEEVVSDRHGGATKNRGALKAASRGATLAVVGMAEGGTAGSSLATYSATTTASYLAQSSGAAGAGIDYDRLAAALVGDRLLGYRDNRDAHLAALRTALAEQPVLRVPRDTNLPVGAY